MDSQPTINNPQPNPEAPNPIYTELTEKSLHLVYVALTVLSLLVLSALTVFFTTLCRSHKGNNEDYSPNSVRYEIAYQQISEEVKASKDKAILIDAAQAAKLDSALNTMAANQTYILKRQDDLVNDIRQETNNNLDKFAAWLSFWIAVMALVGTLLPIVLSFITHHREEQVRKRTEEEIKTFKRQTQKEINEDIKKAKDSVSELMIEVKTNSLEMTVNGLKNGIESNIFKSVSNAEFFENLMLKDIIKLVNDIIGIMRSKDIMIINRSEEVILASILASLHTALQSIVLASTNQKRLRLANKCKDQITSILTQLSHPDTTDKTEGNINPITEESRNNSTISRISLLCIDMSMLANITTNDEQRNPIK